jgi:signal transduction histidine kinase/HAMP domain-containing protein
MEPILTLISAPPYIELPRGLLGWVGWLALLGVVVSLFLQWRKYDRPRLRQSAWLIALLIISTPLASLFIGLRLPIPNALPLPGLPVNPLGPAVLFFSALPWMLAAGLLGPSPAALVALLSGIFTALWDTHDPFTPLVIVLLALVCSAALRQPYRTTSFRLLRHPLAASVLLTLLFPIVQACAMIFNSQGALVLRLDYALSSLVTISLAAALELLIAGLIAEILMRVSPAVWPSPGVLQPSPAERSLQTRFLVNMAPLAAVLILTLMLGVWFVAGRAAREMVETQMRNTAEMVAQNVPYFLETGQNLLLEYSRDPRLFSDDPEKLQSTLGQLIELVPFFDQLVVLDEDGQPITSYPSDYPAGSQIPVEEQMGIQSVLEGMPFLTFTTSPAPGEDTARVSFLAALSDEDQTEQRVLIGRSSLHHNPLTEPLISSLFSLTKSDGQGILVDENNRILVHPDPALVMTRYTGPTGQTPFLFEDTAPDGTRLLSFYMPAVGRPWFIVASIPAYRAQEITLNIALPLLGMIIILSLLAVPAIRSGTSKITASLQNLASEANNIAQGRLDHALAISGEDETALLGRSFEQMRVSLKARLEELNRLLVVSQGVASSLEISETVQPILESAQAIGASTSRIVLTPNAVPELDGSAVNPVSFGGGASPSKYHELDQQLLALTRQHDRLVLSNTTRPRLLNFIPGMPRPESVAAVALRHENNYFGALWVAYDQQHAFTEEEVRFLATLGSQAAVAAANASLFMSAEIGRQRLASILDSSPDPMLVTNQNDLLLLANTAAWQALELGPDNIAGQPIDQVISQGELLELLRASSAEKHSKEIPMPDGRIYLATASPVLAEAQRVGRVCVLRDVTHFKELDALKSDFVSTVSHDLRSPLTLMRGYATMLEMVGQLNEQQTGYVRKIITGVESMSRLVNNLLDLGRIEAGVGLQLEMIPVHDVIERVVGALQLQAAQKHITLTTEIPKQTIPLIEADQSLLQQALQNLIENAIKYTRNDGKVHVRVLAQPVGMVFQITDTGIGISPMDMPRLFEKFYRGAQQAAKEQRGTGLGLAIVKSIAERHGGRVWAESQLGKGSSFYMAIPIRQRRPETQESK